MKLGSEKAYAKVNLTLDVLGRRSDGYHDLRSFMQTVSLHDTITLTKATSRGIEVVSNLPYLPLDLKNLVGIATAVFFQELGCLEESVRLEIQKGIPVCAGLGGGSADAAATLRLLDRVYQTNLSAARLEQMASRIGSDAPFCVRGGTQLAEGRGERLTDISPLPACHIVLCKPPIAVSTRDVFAGWKANKHAAHPDHAGMTEALTCGDIYAIASRMYNVLEEVMPSARADIARIRDTMRDAGALGAVMSGSGPTVLGLFKDENTAQAAGEILKAQYTEIFYTQPSRTLSFF